MKKTSNYIIINIPKDFYDAPSSRFRSDWEHSWQEFYEDYLSKTIDDIVWGKKLKIILDWAWWYGPSFLSQAFWTLRIELEKKGINIWNAVEFEAKKMWWVLKPLHDLVEDFNPNETK